MLELHKDMLLGYSIGMGLEVLMAMDTGMDTVLFHMVEALDILVDGSLYLVLLYTVEFWVVPAHTWFCAYPVDGLFDVLVQ